MKFKDYIKESLQRHMDMYKARNGKWYLNLAADEYGEYEDSQTFGPFPNEKRIEDFLDNFANAGGGSTDRSGKQPVPKRSVNGDKVWTPKEYLGAWGKY